MAASKKWYIGWRSNPQLSNGGYYKDFGQMSKKEVNDRVRGSVYGGMSVAYEFDNEKDYRAKIDELKSHGKRVL